MTALVGRFPWLIFLLGTEQKGNITKKMWRRGVDCRQRTRRRKFMEEGIHT